MSKRLCELGRLEGPHRSFVDCWKDTYTGLYESELEEPERSRSLNASKKLISRLAKNESVLKSFEEELQEVVKSRDHEEQGDITSRVERGAHIFDRIDDERAIDGSNDEVGRLVPFLDRLAQVKEHCYHENDVISKEEFDTILACAVNTARCIVLKDRKHRQRGRAPRGELTSESFHTVKARRYTLGCTL